MSWSKFQAPQNCPHRWDKQELIRIRLTVLKLVNKNDANITLFLNVYNCC